MNAMLTTAEVAGRLRCSAWKVLTEAKRHGIGIRLGGRAGFRFTEADYERLLKALRPTPEPTARRRRRRSS